MKTPLLFPVSATIAFLVAGCQTMPRVESVARPGTDFSAYKTYAVLPLPPGGPPSDPGLSLRLSDTAVQAVTEALLAKGFEKKPNEEADVAVALRGQAVPRIEVTDWGYRPYYYGRRGYWYGGYHNVDVWTYEDRTLIVEIFDNKTKELVWSGWATSSSNRKISAEEMRTTLQRILDRFPPGPAVKSK